MFNRFNVLTYIAENFKIWFRPIILTTAVVIILLFWNKKNNNNTIVLKQYAKKNDRKRVRIGYQHIQNTGKGENMWSESRFQNVYLTNWNYYPFIRKNLPFKMILKKRDYLFYISFTTTMKRFFGKEWNKAAGKKWLYKNLGNI